MFIAVFESGMMSRSFVGPHSSRFVVRLDVALLGPSFNVCAPPIARYADLSSKSKGITEGRFDIPAASSRSCSTSASRSLSIIRDTRLRFVRGSLSSGKTSFACLLYLDMIGPLSRGLACSRLTSDSFALRPNLRSFSLHALSFSASAGSLSTIPNPARSAIPTPANTFAGPTGSSVRLYNRSTSGSTRIPFGRDPLFSKDFTLSSSS
mmetsp:Transcript_5295/g.9407  ORF Transcript_5295/g.9407 Transcript_5295/m.9407 type:complete len:208 (-) Transcript_5295:944-1567(-)